MKTAALLIPVLFSFMASAQNLSLKCEGRVLKVGGKSGEFNINLAPGTLDIDAAGVVLSGAGLACGAVLPSGMMCAQKTSGPNLPVQILQNCGEEFRDTSSYTHFPFETKVVFDPSGTHGRFYCRNYEQKVFVALELSNCRAP